MYQSGIEPGAWLENSSKRLHKLIGDMFDGFEFRQPTVALDAVEDLYEQFNEDTLFLVRDGIINLCSNDVSMLSCEEGDLIGISQSFHLPSPTLATDGYVELQPINRDDFLLHVYADKRRQHAWSHYLVILNSLLTERLAVVSRDQLTPAAGFLNFSAGETIIMQGDDADLVYTIISGRADIVVDGVSVGELGVDEVFGAMAVFTGEKRSASIIAITPCTVMAVPQKDFTVLIEAQPQAAVNLIENLSRRITMMNQQVLEQH